MDRARVDERSDLAQLRPVCTHEEERVGGLVAAAEPPDLAAQQRHHRAQLWLAELAGECRVGRSADADDQARLGRTTRTDFLMSYR